jgi:3-oxoacyl-[acyl-carrier-protein] synthase II
MGIISPIGIGLDEYWQSLVEGRSGVKNITAFDVSELSTQFAGIVEEFDPFRWIDRKQAKRMDRTCQFGVAAAKMAVEDAGLAIHDRNSSRIGVVMGTCVALEWVFANHVKMMEKGARYIHPLTVLSSFPDAAAGQIAIGLGVKGLNVAISTACSSASNSLGYAMSLIRSGDLDVVIAGGTECPVLAPVIGAFDAARALSTRNESPHTASRPFDLTRDGFVMGEGAGILVVESLSHAVRRNAFVYAELAGYGCTCDAYHMTAPQPNTREQVRAIRLALDSAGVYPTEVDFLNAHGTSTPLNDKSETQCIKAVFGEHGKKISINSTKSMIGHLIGAAGGAEAIATILCMKHGIVHPTINYTTPDPECDLDYTFNRARKREIEIAVSNSFGFGGKNSILVFRKYKDGDTGGR